MGLTREQRRNAEILLGASRRPIIRKAELEAGLVETNLRDLPYGDADSEGLLQQRPSQGWGSRSESAAKDASQFAHAANKILAGGFRGTAGELAQAVQHSAYPGRYQARSGTADELIRTLGSGAAASPRSGPSGAAQGASAGQGVPQGSDGLTALLGALTAPQGPPPSAGVQLPSFAAQAPVAGATPVSGGGPAPPVDIGPLLAQIQTQGGDVGQQPQDTSSSTTAPAASSATSGGGVAHFDGKPVAAWIKPLLDYARKRGWKGTVSSGYRTDAEQKRIYDSGVRPAAVPRSEGGGGSNHSRLGFLQGAIDVTDAAALDRILRAKHSRLRYAGAKDPVHFSVPRNGTY